MYKYGFALRHNPWDTVCVTPEELQQASDTELGMSTSRKRLRFLRKQTDILDTDADDAMELSHGSCINAALTAALLVLGASDNLFSSWQCINDATHEFNKCTRPSEVLDVPGAVSGSGSLVHKHSKCKLLLLPTTR